MNKKHFKDLIASVREMGRIIRGESKPGRVHLRPKMRIPKKRTGRAKAL